MNYETYWSILDAPAISIRSHEVFLWIIIFSIVSWILIKKFKKSNGIEKSILLWFTGILGIVSMSMFAYLKIYDKDEWYRETEQMLASPELGKTEGLIENFERGNIASRRGVKYESFTVDTVDFYYSDDWLGRFNQFAKADNWILKNGLPVRITYGKENHKILKFEIAKTHYNP